MKIRAALRNLAESLFFHIGSRPDSPKVDAMSALTEVRSKMFASRRIVTLRTMTDKIEEATANSLNFTHSLTLLNSIYFNQTHILTRQGVWGFLEGVLVLYVRRSLRLSELTQGA